MSELSLCADSDQFSLQLRTMLHDHLVDETQPSTTVRRQAIVSINDIMRFGRVERDKSKVSPYLSSSLALH